MKLQDNCPYKERCSYSEEELVAYAERIQNPGKPLNLSVERAEDMNDCFSFCDFFRNQLFISLREKREKEGADKADIQTINETEEWIRKTIEWIGHGIAY